MASALLCFCIMAACILWAVVISLDRVEQVNARLPKEKQFEAPGWWATKRWRFEKEYERLFPDRALRRKERLLWLLGALALLGAFFFGTRIL
jgi:hypothetical protein